MKTPFYRRVFQESFALARHHRMLWVFGLFVALLGHMGVTTYIVRMIAGDRTVPFVDIFAFPYVVSTGLHAAFSSSLGWPGGLLCLFVLAVALGLIAVLITVSLASQGTLIISSAQAMKQRHYDVDEIAAWHESVPHLPELFALQVFKRGTILCLASFLGAALVNYLQLGGFVHYAIFVGLAMGAIFLSIVVTVVTMYAACGVCLEQQRLKESLVCAWELFRDHWLVTLEIALLLMLAQLLLGFIFLLGFVLVYGELLILLILVNAFALPAFFYTVTSFFTLLAFVLFIMFGLAGFSVMSTSVWTYVYVGMHKKGIKSRLIHFFHG